jgi:hypothetical protein
MRLVAITNAISAQKPDFFVKHNSSDNESKGIQTSELYQSLFGLSKRFKTKQIRVEKSGKQRGEFFNDNNKNPFLNTNSLKVGKKSGSNSGGQAKLFMSENERRKLVQNNLESNILNLMRKSLDDQANKVQLQLKREESMLFDEFIESKVINYNYTRRRKLLEIRNENLNKMKSLNETSENKLPQNDQASLKLETELKFGTRNNETNNRIKTAHIHSRLNKQANDKAVVKKSELVDDLSESLNLFTKEEEEMIKRAIKLNSNLFDRFESFKKLSQFEYFIK